MSDFNNQWIEIFRAGDYGAKGKYDAQFIKDVAANFIPDLWKAPMTLQEAARAQIGHADQAPALGWVKEMKAEGPSLKARFEKVHASLEGLVRDGRFPNRSVAFYLNPLGKGPMLRHVAFLGAMPPEVKGLAPIRFSGDKEFVEVGFSGGPPAKYVGFPVNPQSVVINERAKAIALKLKIPFWDAMRQARKEQLSERFSSESLGYTVNAESVVLNSRAQEIALKRTIPFGEALRQARKEQLSAQFSTESLGYPVNAESIVLDKRAKAIALERNIDFGEALRQAWREKL